MLAGAPHLRADSCQQRIARYDHKLYEAIEHHGYRSEQAEHCWNINIDGRMSTSTGMSFDELRGLALEKTRRRQPDNLK